MILYVAVPRLVGVDIADIGQLSEREKIARDIRDEALVDYATLTAAGYEVTDQYEHISMDGINDVFVMERAGNITELEPVPPAPHAAMV